MKKPKQDKTLILMPVALIGIDALVIKEDGKYYVNEAILTALTEKGLANIYLQCETDEQARIISNQKIIDKLKKAGFNVEVFMPADSIAGKKIGDTYDAIVLEAQKDDLYAFTNIYANLESH
jgi:hypothetical protein